MIRLAEPAIGEEEIEAVEKVLRSGQLSQGKEVRAFEEEFAASVRRRYAIAVANGTAALDLALKALGIGKGDEVITTPFSFIASANCILYQGARPAFVDVEEETLNLNPDLVAERISEATKAILVVHLYGHPAEMQAFSEIVEEKGLLLIEDCSQAHGAEFKRKGVGSFGDVATFSFYATKNMTTGEGGMVVTDDRRVADKLRMLRDHGQRRRGVHELLGYNLRMTEIAAAIGRVQLEKLEKLLEARRRNAEFLTRTLGGVDGIDLPFVRPRCKHAWNLYTIRVKPNFPLGRDQLQRSMAEGGIETGVYYRRPIHRQPLYRKLGYRSDDCPVAIRASREVLSLPIHPKLSCEELERIAERLRA